MLKSWLFLAFNFLFAQLKKILRMRKGVKSFIKNYMEDGIYPVSEEGLTTISSMEKCVSCGYCEIKGKNGVSQVPHILRDISSCGVSFVENLLSGEEECPFGVELSKAKIPITQKEIGF